MTICNQSADEIDKKIDVNAHLRDVLELVNDGLHNGAFALKQDFVYRRHEHIFYNRSLAKVSLN